LLRGTNHVKLKGRTVKTKPLVPPISVTRNGNQNYRIALEPGEAEVLKKLIEKYFQVVFDAKAEQDEAYRAEGGGKTSPKSAPKAAPKPETSVNTEEEDAPF